MASSLTHAFKRKQDTSEIEVYLKKATKHLTSGQKKKEIININIIEISQHQPVSR